MFLHFTGDLAGFVAYYGDIYGFFEEGEILLENDYAN